MVTQSDMRKMDLDLVASIDVESGLSEWEAEFVDSVLKHLRGDSRRVLSPKQRATAERIQRKLDERSQR